MQNEHSEQQAEVQGSAVLEADVEGFVEKNGPNESHLDHEHEHSSVENVDLVIVFQSVLLFVLLHESTIRNSVDVCSQFQFLRLFLS